jgi:hypothetical protein
VGFPRPAAAREDQPGRNNGLRGAILPTHSLAKCKGEDAMIHPRVPMRAWLRLKPDPFAAALALLPGLKADLRALQSYVADTRAVIAALRETWGRPRASTSSRGRRTSARSNSRRQKSRRGNRMRLS